MRPTAFLILTLASMALAACDRAPSSHSSAAPVARATAATTLHFKVSGMVCEGCEHAIADTLKQLPGVLEVHASHLTGEVDVRTTDPSQQSAIVKSIAKLNYTVES